jgi:hypothetical protein
MSIKLQEEYGDKLNVVFVAGGKDTAEQVQGFAMARKWLGGRAMWTSEAPFETGLPYIPAAVLMDSSGEVKIINNPLDIHKKIVELIDSDLDVLKKGPKDAPDVVKKAWQDFGAGNVTKAIAGAQALIDKPPPKDGDAVVAAAKAALAAFNAAVDKRFAAVEDMFADGEYDRALAELDSLGKAVKGNADLTKRQADALAKVNDPALKSERDAAADLARLRDKLYKDGAKDTSAKQLEAWAKAHQGTKAAERAESLARVAQFAAVSH